MPDFERVMDAMERELQKTDLDRMYVAGKIEGKRIARVQIAKLAFGIAIGWVAMSVLLGGG